MKRVLDRLDSCYEVYSEAFFELAELVENSLDVLGWAATKFLFGCLFIPTFVVFVALPYLPILWGKDILDQWNKIRRGN